MPAPQHPRPSSRSRERQSASGPGSPDRKRLQSTHGEKAIERPGDRAHRVLQKSHFFCKVVAVHHHSAADSIAVSVQIFRGRVNDEIEAVFERPLHVGGGECIVCRSPDAAPPPGLRRAGRAPPPLPPQPPLYLLKHAAGSG